MSNNIKGITIELGGNAENLNSALKSVNKAAGDAQSGLKEVNKQLKFDPKDVVLSGQKVDLLKDKVAALEDKQKTLKTAVDQAHEAFDKGDLGKDKVQAVEREYEKTNSQLKDSKKALIEAEAANGSFVAKVKLKFSDLKGKIKETFSAKNIKAGLGAVGVAVGGFLKSSVDEAGEAERANVDLVQTLKSTRDASGMTVQSLNDLTQAMVQNTTFSDDEVKAGEGMLLTFTNIGKNVFPQATAALLDMSQKMGTDTKNQAMQLGKALNDPVKGVTALTKVGVTFTDQQKKQIAAMEKVGNTAGAQKVILAELNKEFGGQATAAASTYAGEQKKVGNELKEVKETIGTALLPVLAKLLKSGTPIIQSVMNFVSKNPKLVAGILAVIAVVGTLVGGMQLLTAVTTFFGLATDASLAPILPVVLAVTAAVIGLSAAAIAITTHWKQVSGFFVNLWNTIKGLFSGIGQWFQSVFAAGADGAKSSWSGITGFFSGIWNGISTAFMTVKNAVTGAFSSAANGFKQVLNGLKSALIEHKSQIIAVAAVLGTIFGPALIKTGAQAATAGAQVASGFITNLAKSGAAAVENGAKIAAGFTANVVKSGAQAVVNGAKIAVSFVGNLAKAGVAAVANGAKIAVSFTGSLIKSGAQAVASGAKVTASFVASMAKAAAQAVKTGLSITGSLIKTLASYAADGWKTVASITAQTGAWIAQKAAMAASVVATKAAAVAQKLLNAAMNANPIGIVITLVAALIVALIALFNNNKAFHDWVVNAWNTLKALAVTVGNGVKDAFIGAWNGIKAAWSAVTVFFAGIWRGIQSIFSAVGGWFRNIFGSAWNGIKSIWSGVTGFFSGVWHGITGIFGTVGNWFSGIFKGAYSGITNAFSGLVGFFSGIWNGITDGVKSAINFVIGGINILIGGLDKLHFSAPSWVPLIGGKSFGINIPKIPLLAQGGIVDRATLAMVGEAGKEAVLPLDRNTGWMQQLATLMAETFKNIIPVFDSGPQVHTAMVAAYGGHSVPAPAGASSAGGTMATSGQTGDVKVYQYFQGKTPSPAEHARLTRNSLQQIVKKLR